jgi:16S rRNA (cytidine1402-2'-O)-methyltransferase
MKKLVLIPSYLGDKNYNTHFPIDNKTEINEIKVFFVEDIRTARRFLGHIKVKTPIQELIFEVLDRKTTKQEAQSLFKRYKNQPIGVISEAGCPGIADPGALAVEVANDLNYEIVPLVGPSSITLALMGSGLNGQSFKFVGYIPVKKPERIKRIKELDTESLNTKTTQIFIETPYRNEHLFTDLINNLHPETRLCVACGLLSEHQFIKTKKAKDWLKAQKPNIAKIPTIFMFLNKE